MRIIYLRNKPELSFLSPTYWKVIEKDEETAITMSVKKDSIEVEESEDYFDRVSFIKNKLCSENESVEIDQKEFDEFYKNTVENINAISSY